MESTVWLWITDRNCFQNCRWLGWSGIIQSLESPTSKLFDLHCCQGGTLYTSLLILSSSAIMSPERLTFTMPASSQSLFTHCTTSETIHHWSIRWVHCKMLRDGGRSIDQRALKGSQKIELSWSPKSSTVGSFFLWLTENFQHVFRFMKQL